MSEYIDKQAVLDALCEADAITMRGVRILNAIPTADVRPVVHGHKVTHNRPIAGHWECGYLEGGFEEAEVRVWVAPIKENPVDYCSECGKRLDDIFQNFCPNCGVAIGRTEEVEENDD